MPFELPPRDELDARLGSVLEVIYLVFNEGYAATAGDDWIRPALLEEALRLGRILAGLVPDEPEVHGLAALMEIQASRSRARVGPAGEPVLLLDQDRAPLGPAPDQARPRRARAGRGARRRARAVRAPGGDRGMPRPRAAGRGHRLGPDRGAVRRAGRAHAVTGGRAEPGRGDRHGRRSRTPGLEIVDELVAQGALDGYHLLPAVRGDLLEKLGRQDEARAEFELAASMTRNSREREQLLIRVRALG